ncbi:uncharacterized protein LOC131616353 isoform X1 [Vicia villosa]|uniref:uncharacterized protein LOC131616353 isoform X1 n=1 Tax=Vicia villosa TaxID=3911 RepID=UPI00273B9BC8|nr:uncharacterized protein LOC131616353 isoform X1 [Vicia villosa]
MTLSTIKPCTLFMFICLVLLLISTWEVEAKIFCGRPSRTWSGPCIDTECDRECIDSEKFSALHHSSSTESTMVEKSQHSFYRDYDLDANCQEKSQTVD